MSSRDSLTPAYVLHRRDYSDTSLIIDFLTLQHGHVSCMARGVKKSRNNRSALLQPFVPLLIDFSGRGSLKNLHNCESAEQQLNLQGSAVYAGFYLNELVMQIMRKYELNAQVFVNYAKTLIDLAEGLELENLLRAFELRLLQEAGVGLQFYADQAQDWHPELDYLYNPFHDSLRPADDCLASAGDITISGETLLALNKGQLETEFQRRQGKLLMRAVLNHHLDGYDFKSRRYFGHLFNKNN